jgi:hypothetical protein
MLTPRVEKAGGAPLFGLALSLCLMAAIAALAFVVACAALNNIARRLVGRRAISTECVVIRIQQAGSR